MLDQYWQNARRVRRKGEISFALGCALAQICPAYLQGEDVYPLENNQGKEAYAIFGDSAAMLRHGVKKYCVDCPEIFRT